jgi:hypothetical protein
LSLPNKISQKHCYEPGAKPKVQTGLFARSSPKIILMRQKIATKDISHS